MHSQHNKSHKVRRVNKQINASKGSRRPEQTVMPCPSAEMAGKNDPNTDVHCDIASLTVADKLSKKCLTATSHDHAPLRPGVPHHIVSDLEHYDLVLEVVSDYKLVGSLGELTPEVNEEYHLDTPKAGEQREVKKFAKLDISRTGKGACPRFEHPSVEVVALSSDDPELSRDWQTSQPKTQEIPARALTERDRAAQWLLPFWPFSSSPIELSVVAAGCGVGFESPVNLELNAKVRIYPNDHYELNLSLPPFRKREHETKKQHFGMKKFESESNSRSSFGKKTSTDEYERDDQKGELKYKTGHSADGRYGETETTYDKEGHIEHEDRHTDHSGSGLLSLTTKDDDEYSDGSIGTSLTLTIKRNGSTVDTAKKLAALVKTITQITHLLSTIKEALDTVPKIGLTYKWDLSVLQGSVTGTWGYRQMDGPSGSGPRYVAVEKYFDLDVGVKLFEASLDLGWGFDLTIPAILDWFEDPTLELILKAAVKASAELSVKYKAISSSKENHKVKVETEPALTVYIECKVMLCGKGLDADAGVRGGFKAEGSFRVSFTQPLDFELDAGMKPVVAYARFFVDSLLYDTSKHWEYELIAGRQFHKGPIPSKEEHSHAAVASE